MTQTGGLDFLMGWGIFAALLVVLGFFLLRGGEDATSESEHGNSESTSSAQGPNREP